MDDDGQRQRQSLTVNGYRSFGQGGNSPQVAFDLPIYHQVNALQNLQFDHSHFDPGRTRPLRDEWNQEPDSWVHRPPNTIYPPLPDGYSYVKNYALQIHGNRKPWIRRNGFYGCTWSRTGFHDLYIMSLWANTDERILIVEETELNNKVEEWTSICAAMEENVTYIICEPTQMGRRVHRYTIVGNFIHRLIVKSCVVTCLASLFWPHKRYLYWAPFLFATLGVLIYRDVSQDPACNYQVVKDPYLISRFPLYRFRSMDATIMRYHSHKRRWFTQTILYTLTALRVVYLTVFPAPPCICDWNVVAAMMTRDAAV